MNRKVNTPPALAQRFLLAFLRDDLAEEVLGDLDEFYARALRRHSAFKARVAYWIQVFKYLRPFAVRKFLQFTLINTSMIRNYLITAFRTLWKNKKLASINIFGLAMGIACSLLITLFVKDELAYDKH